jgi:hypothetical protein
MTREVPGSQGWGRERSQDPCRQLRLILHPVAVDSTGRCMLGFFILGRLGRAFLDFKEGLKKTQRKKT